LTTLGFTHIKFVIQPGISQRFDNIQNTNKISETNAFTILMENANKLALPAIKKEETRHDLLYNDIIKLLKQEKIGWTGGLHETVGKKFVERLVVSIWYIDSHLQKFSARKLNLPKLFLELNQFKLKLNYNHFYFERKHKKQQLACNILTDLTKSLTLSISAPWACAIIWEQVIEQVLALIKMIDQYANFLNKANDRMHEIHYSGAPARDPSINLEVYTIDASSNNMIKEVYEELANVLSSENEYDFINMEHYLPKDVLKRYDYIKNLQLDIPVTIYRYHQGNYLGTLNYI